MWNTASVTSSLDTLFKVQTKYILFINSLCSARVFAGSSQYCETDNYGN